MKHHALQPSSLTLLALAALGVAGWTGPAAREAPRWYTQGDFGPASRFALELTNELDIDRVNVPVVVRREEVPIADLHELAVTVVDPTLPPSPEPSAERLKIAGGHERRPEANGHAIRR